MHKYLVLNTTGGIGCEPCTAGDLKGINRLDKSDGSDGYEILLIFCRGIIFSYNVGYKAQIVKYQLLSHGGIPFFHLDKVFSLGLGGEGRGKVLGRGYSKNKVEKI